MNDLINRNRTAADVAQMETDLAYFRDQNEKLSREVHILTGEKNRLQVENTLLQASSMENHRKASRVEAILDNVCNGLVMSLKGLREERALAVEMRKQVREEVAPIENRVVPKPRLEPPPAPPEIEYEEPPAPRDLDQEARDRADRLRGAAEHVAPRLPVNPRMPPARPATARIDETLANRDPRMPKMVDVGTGDLLMGRPTVHEEPEGELAALANIIGRQTQPLTRR